jgi:heat-inducible transcriptional repressor
VTTTKDKNIYYSGAGNILAMPEFADLSMAHSIFEMLDQAEWWEKVFERTCEISSPYYVLLGQEWGSDELEQCGYIFSSFKIGNVVEGSIGVVGPLRLNYQYIIPTVEYLSKIISEMAEK